MVEWLPLAEKKKKRKVSARAWLQQTETGKKLVSTRKTTTWGGRGLVEGDIEVACAEPVRTKLANNIS